jgi:hypothetical protein
MTCLSHLLSRLAVAAFAAVLLAACTTLLNAPVYDPEIEAGLNQYHRDTTAFIKKMESLGPEGAYGNPESRDFYAQNAGLLANLVVRAEASGARGTCELSKATTSGLGALISGTVESIESQEGDPGFVAEFKDDLKTSLTEFNRGTSDLSVGSCLTVALMIVKSDHEVLESIHKDEVRIGPDLSRLLRKSLNDGVSIALINVQSSKP